jgi:hypothetical protein
MKWKPKVDKQSRLVMTRFNISTDRDREIWCYQITRITRANTLDKRFKPLYAVVEGDGALPTHFKNSRTGDLIRIIKSKFKSVSRCLTTDSPVDIFNKS